MLSQRNFFMITVYVKHYLNKAGIEYFQTQWFVYVEIIIKKQDGFIDIISHQDKFDPTCINITIKFTGADQLKKWAKSSLHKEVISKLDPYRIAGQRWLVDEKSALDAPPTDINLWEHAPLAKAINKNQDNQ